MGRRIVQVMLVLGCLALFAFGFTLYATIQSVPKLLKRNAELGTQGYYMGEFEFKMVDSQHYLKGGTIWTPIGPCDALPFRWRTCKACTRGQSKRTAKRC